MQLRCQSLTLPSVCIEIRTDCLINMKEDIQTHYQHQDLQCVCIILDADLYLTLSGAPLQTDHILISDIGLSDNTALTCWNWMTQHTISSNFAWYHRHKEVNRIRWNGNSMGWQSKIVTSGGRKAWTNTNKDVWCFSRRRDSHLHIFKQGVCNLCGGPLSQ